MRFETMCSRTAGWVAAGVIGQLTGINTTRGSINCGGIACVCNGAGTCNTFISACVELDLELNCNKFDEMGQPVGCSCTRP